MITTATMIRLGHVHGNKMVDLQLSNAKLRQRALDIIVEKREPPYSRPRITRSSWRSAGSD